MNENVKSSLVFKLSSLFFLLTLFFFTGCAMTEKNKCINYSRIIDLSHEIHTGIPLWPGDPDVIIENVANFEKEGYFLRRFSIGEHSATHMNSPSSFLADGISIDQYSPESLVVKAVVIDIRDKAEANSDYMFSIEDVHEWEKEHERIPPNHLVILYTGWQEKWSTPDLFMNIDDSGTPRFPGFSGDCTKFLLEERQIAGVGIDTHGVDPGIDENFLTNTQVLSNNGIVLECLTHLDKLPPKGITLAIGSLRLREGSGSPVTVMAFVE